MLKDDDKDDNTWNDLELDPDGKYAHKLVRFFILLCNTRKTPEELAQQKALTKELAGRGGSNAQALNIVRVFFVKSMSKDKSGNLIVNPAQLPLDCWIVLYLKEDSYCDMGAMFTFFSERKLLEAYAKANVFYESALLEEGCPDLKRMKEPNRKEKKTRMDGNGQCSKLTRLTKIC